MTYQYKNVWNKGKPRTEHCDKAVKALGKPLPKEAEVHHVDGNRFNNENSNLVVCPNHAYHMLLHRRTKALEECGDANKVKCMFCGEYSLPHEMRVRVRRGRVTDTERFTHPVCENAYQAEYRKRKC